jgi:hypothetical protein
MTFNQICLCLGGLELLRERERAAGHDVDEIDELIDKLNDLSRSAGDDEGDDDELDL